VSKLILRDCFIEIDGEDLSNRASAVTVEEPGDEVDVSSFGGQYHEVDRGLLDATMTVTFFQDHDSGSVDDVLQPLHKSGDPFLIRVRPVKAASMSATNPERRMVGKLFNYSPIAGAVGEASTTDVTIRNASESGVTRHPS
jgi:hypothetical protein